MFQIGEILYAHSCNIFSGDSVFIMRLLLYVLVYYLVYSCITLYYCLTRENNISLRRFCIMIIHQ